VWTFVVRDGKAFNLQVPGNPILSYRGGLDILKAVLTDAEAEHVTGVCEDNGCTVQAATEDITDEQEQERKALLGVNREDYVWPSARCPECAWFDVMSANNCGADDWPTESQTSLHLHNEKARTDLAACPLGKQIEIRLNTTEEFEKAFGDFDPDPEDSEAKVRHFLTPDKDKP